jgi:hypothetical protein
MKRCSKCKIEKEESYFNKDKSRKGGLEYVCKECKKQYAKDNAEKIAEYHKQYNQDNAEKIAERQKQYYKDNVEHIAEQGKQYQKNNVEKIKQYRKDNSEKFRDRDKRYRQAHPEKFAERKKLYYNNNIEKIREYQKQYYKDNADKWADNNLRYYKDKYNTDEQYRMCRVLRARLSQALQGRWKYGSTIRDLGCSIECLIAKLRSDLGREPTSDDQIDHIIPFHLLNMSKKSHQQFVCHYTNLRWLPSKVNLSRDYCDLLDFPELYNKYLDLIASD